MTAPDGRTGNVLQHLPRPFWVLQPKARLSFAYPCIAGTYAVNGADINREYLPSFYAGNSHGGIGLHGPLGIAIADAKTLASP